MARHAARVTAATRSANRAGAFGMLGGASAGVLGVLGVARTALGILHGRDSFTIGTAITASAQDVARANYGINYVAAARAMRAEVLSAEAVAVTAGGVAEVSPRLNSFRRSPVVAVKGLSAPDLARVVRKFERYGYTLGAASTPSTLLPCQAFSYWRTSETTILGAGPAEARASIAAAFERGVTVWADPALIGTSPANPPAGGIVV